MIRKVDGECRQSAEAALERVDMEGPSKVRVLQIIDGANSVFLNLLRKLFRCAQESFSVMKVHMCKN